MKIKFSLIIPCFNEGLNLPLVINRCRSLAAQGGIEVIFVDNGSTDNSYEIFEKELQSDPCLRLVKVMENKGYGHGILAGLSAANGDFLGWTHADMQTDPNDFLLAKAEIENNQSGDIFVKGTRYGRPAFDRFFATGMSIFETLLLAKPFWDVNAQPTVFSKKFFEGWENPPNDFALDLFAYYEAKRQGIGVRRFPVKFSSRAFGSSHWNVDWPSKWKFIKRTFNYSLSLKKRYRI
jgi:glycosyltransferase involved in cell wall biosynthesis